MRFDTLLLCALVILGELSGTARAELLGQPASPPRFSKSDTSIITRNELLSAIVDKDPWLVRRMLDALERLHGTTAPSAQSIAGLDPKRDPDLAGATRTAEGSVEWLELLKRARDEKEGRRSPPGATGRSAEGSVELIEMMKRAKEMKDSVK